MGTKLKNIDWQLVLTVVGYIFLAGIFYQRVNGVQADVEVLKTEQKQATTDVSEIKGDIKSIKSDVSWLRSAYEKGH
jgi:outer membrane murein-binding lipoprotein Lpp